MASNPDKYYGLSVRCISDADEFFSTVSGIGVIAQDSIHRITCDSVLGSNGADWGIDIRQMVGAKQRELTLNQPRIIEVLERDDRIDSADVTLTDIERSPGLHDIQIELHLETALGPFDLTRLLSEITETQLENLGS
jgi:hypothetical protein